MRMTDVITRFRELNPDLQERVADLAAKVGKASRLADDMRTCRTDEARRALAGEVFVAIMEAELASRDVAETSAAMDTAVRSYTRVFADGADDTEADAALVQPELPGLEGSGADDPTVGDGETVIDPA